MEKICQSCGMPLSDEVLGIEANGTLSNEYCKFCYQGGEFTEPDLTLEEQIVNAANFADQAGMTVEEVTAWAKATHPTLKRWKK